MITTVRILYLEPFDGGSHAEFTRVLVTYLPADWTVLTLPGRHWKWRMRGAMLHFANCHRGELERDYDLVLASSYLPLAELIAFAPKLAGVPKILYFHENQLTYPVREEQERDTHFGFTQLVSAALADLCLFNSEFNRISFVTAASELMERMPDARPTWAIDHLSSHSQVLPLPMDLPKDLPGDLSMSPTASTARPEEGPLILWNHRWEYDKNPESFFAVLRSLADEGQRFRVAVCGERFRNSPKIFAEASEWLGDRIRHWGRLDLPEYQAVLREADCVVSTAHHEFFGLAILEAVHFGCRPFVPDRLSYPELFPPEYRYRDDADLLTQLRQACEGYGLKEADLRADRRALTHKYSREVLLPRYRDVFESVCSKS